MYVHRLDKEEFVTISKAIVELLPTETVGTYFIPSIGSIQAKGKLWSAYKNLRYSLQQAKLIKSREKRRVQDQTGKLKRKLYFDYVNYKTKFKLKMEAHYHQKNQQ